MSASDAQKKATAKYKASHYKRVSLDLPILLYNKILPIANDKKLTVSGFIKQVLADIASDKE